MKRAFMVDFTKTEEAMTTAISDGVFPSASLLVAKNGEIVFRRNFGDCLEATIFDVASLTKPVVTTTLTMIAVAEGLLNLNDDVSLFLPDAPHLGAVKIYNLLNHSSGLPAWQPYHQEIPHEEVASVVGRKQIIDKVKSEPLQYATGTKSFYSDIGFILMDVILESVFAEPLITLFEELVAKPLGMASSFYRLVKETPWSADNFLPAYEAAERDFAGISFAPTEDCPWRRRVVQGFVHDPNCYCMGGVSGHAGLFSTVDDLHIFVKKLVSSLRGEGNFLKTEIVREFINAYTSTLEFKHPGTFLLGWDRPSHANSQAGHMFPKDSIGHLGYTGCSLWINLEKDIWVILLSNRIHPSSTNEKIKAFRPAIHDRIAQVLGV